ncbi:MAG: hypothetical protein P4L43_19330 [Syntrophobacteraceae bacterium]|nr:hypothetical protein [Syntrophobacteraceae bacterium]
MQQPLTHGVIQNLVNLIRPWHLGDQGKFRVGADADGGYVLPDCAQRTRLVFSIGIGDEVSFDARMAALGARVLQFDHTIAGTTLQHPGVRYFKQGWGPQDNAEESLLSLNSMMALADWDGATCPILKFDTEGAEWDSLIATQSSDLARFEILTGEFHDFQNLVNQDYFEKVYAVFTKLFSTHKVVHLHANNAGGFVMVGGMPFPRLLELTYLRNDAAIFTSHSTEPIPGPLDRPNLPQFPDLYLRVF